LFAFSFAFSLPLLYFPHISVLDFEFGILWSRFPYFRYAHICDSLLLPLPSLRDPFTPIRPGFGIGHCASSSCALTRSHCLLLGGNLYLHLGSRSPGYFSTPFLFVPPVFPAPSKGLAFFSSYQPPPWSRDCGRLPFNAVSGFLSPFLCDFRQYVALLILVNCP